MENQQIRTYEDRLLAPSIKRALIREVFENHMITPSQFNQLMELQRGR